MQTKINDVNFEEEVIKSPLPVLVDFWAEWCAPCHMVAPAVAELADEYAGKLKVCKSNVDEGPGIASRYKIRAIPTLMIFKDGQMVDQIVGVVPKQHLEGKIKPHLSE